MNRKTLGLMSAGLLLVVLFFSLTSALTLTGVSSVTLDQNDLSETFTLTTNVDADFSINTASPITLTDSSNHVITLNFIGSGASAVTSNDFTVTASGDISNFNFPESASTNVIFYAENTTDPLDNVTKTITFTFDNTDFCKDCENKGNLDIAEVDIKVIKGFGDDDEYWYPFDEIEVEVNVENNGLYDVDGIEIEWVIYTASGKKIMDGTLKDFNLKDDKDETVTFKFKLNKNIDDFEGEDSLFFHIRAKGTIDDNSAGIFDGEDTCDSEKIEVDIYADDDFVILTDIKINGFALNGDVFEEYDLKCGEEVTITADVWNIGSDDQEEISMIVYNKALGIQETFELGDIDAYENKEISFNIIVPKDVDSKWYTLNLEVYDEDNDLFENSKDDESIFDVVFKTSEECSMSEPIISAELLTEAKENKEMSIKVSIKNTGSKAVVYSVNAAGYADWADLTEIGAKTLELNAGETKDVIFTFMTKKDSAGERFFNLEVVADNKLVKTQPVVVSIEEANKNVSDFIKANWKILVIALVNLILIIAIIIVAVRTYRR